jgi:hypothetical protein
VPIAALEDPVIDNSLAMVAASGNGHENTFCVPTRRFASSMSCCLFSGSVLAVSSPIKKLTVHNIFPVNSLNAFHFPFSY